MLDDTGSNSGNQANVTGKTRVTLRRGRTSVGMALSASVQNDSRAGSGRTVESFRTNSPKKAAARVVWVAARDEPKQAIEEL